MSPQHQKYGCKRCEMRYLAIPPHADSRRCICGGDLQWLGPAIPAPHKA